MWDIKACRGCLNTTDKLDRISNVYKRIYAVMTGLEISSGDGYPWYFCVECNMQIKKTLAFRRKCRRAFFVLKEIMSVRNQVTLSDVMTVDRQKTNLVSPLTIDTRIVTNIKPDNCEELDRLEEQSRLEEERALEESRQEEFDQNDQEGDIDINDVDLDDVFKDLKEEEIEDTLENEEIFEEPKKKTVPKTKTSSRSSIERDRLRMASRALSHCTIRVLSEEEQALAYQQRALAEPFCSASYKCRVCLTTYRDMPQLVQHIHVHNNNASSAHKCAICCLRLPTDEELSKHRAECHLYEFTCGDCGAVKYTIGDLNKCYAQHGGAPPPERARTHFYSTVYRRFFTVTPLPHHLMYQTLASSSGGQRHVCTKCKIGFHKRQELVRHTAKHVEASKENGFKYNCDICGLATKSIGQMRKHMIAWHLSSYTCVRCGHVCMNRMQVTQHGARHDRNEIPSSFKKSYTCEYCGKSFVHYSAYNAHLRSKHMTKRYTSHCIVCGMSLASRYELYWHQLAEHKYLSVPDPTLGDPQFRCAPCDVQFMNHTAYQTHLVRNYHKESFQIKLACRQHKLLFKTDEEMAAHDAVCVHKTRKYPKPCHSCDTVVVTAKEWRTHQQVAHGNWGLRMKPTAAPSKRLCELCGMTVNRSTMRNHVCYRRRAVGATTCPHCNVSLLSAERHVLHMLRVHTHRPYHCALCNARYKHRYECKDHILKMHAPEKPFECGFCPRRFSHENFVLQHARKAHDADLRAEHRRRAVEALAVKKHKLFVYRLMKIDASLVSADMLHRAKLQICDYTDTNFKDVPLEEYSNYIILDDQETTSKEPPCRRRTFKRSPEYSDEVPQKRMKQVVTDDRHFVIKAKIKKEDEEFSGKEVKEEEEVRPTRPTRARGKRSVDDARYECGFCRAVLPGANRYAVHVVYNHTLRPYRCALCPARFKHRCECRDHILKIHEPVTPYQCKYCPQRFSHTSALNTHSTSEHGLVQIGKTRRDTWSPMKGKFYVYPHMKIDVRWIGQDILEKAGLEICDYLDENNRVLDDYTPYVVFSNDGPIKSRKNQEPVTRVQNIIGKSMVSLDTDEETDANGEENLLDEHLTDEIAKNNENIVGEREMDDKEEIVEGTVEEEEIALNDNGVLIDDGEDITLELDSKQVVNVDGVDHELLIKDGEQFVIIEDVLYKIETLVE